jgi:FixJ family two-component response regulator
LRQIKAPYSRLAVNTRSPELAIVNARPLTESKDREVTVRIVDDDPAVLGSLRFSLEIEGFKVETFGSAEDFLSAPPRANACLLIDQHLKAANGLDLIEAIRHRGDHSPIVLITSQPSAAVQRRAAAAGVPIIEKPFLGNTLIDTIRSIMAHADFKPSRD